MAVRIVGLGTGDGSITNLDLVQVGQDSKQGKQPDTNHHYHHNVDNFFDGWLHRNIGIDQPK